MGDTRSLDYRLYVVIHGNLSGTNTIAITFGGLQTHVQIQMNLQIHPQALKPTP